MRNINRWLNHETDEVVISETRPYSDKIHEYEQTHENRDTTEYDFLCSRAYQFYPAINVRRVHGSSYTPYTGFTEWSQAANHELRDIATGKLSTRQAVI